MRIGIDIKCLRYNKAGIGRYLRSILDELQETDHQNEYFLFTPAATDYKPKNSNFKVLVCKSKIRQPGILWQQFTLPLFIRKNKIDVFWGPEQTLPLHKIKGTSKVLTVHDFVYKRFPKTMAKSVLFINRHFGSKSIKVADYICPVSNFTKQELCKFFPKTNENKIRIVCNGVKADHVQSAQKRGSELLFVGSLEPRKNLKNLLIALETLHGKGLDIPLVLTGPKGWKNASIKKLLEKSPIAKNIRHLGYVSETELELLYETCAAVVFPSLYEGFGLPVLEAFAHGAPVLTTKGSVMEDIAGKYAYYFKATEPQSIADTIEKFYQERPSFEIKNAERDLGIAKILNKYSWEHSAKALLKVFEEACEKRTAQ